MHSKRISGPTVAVTRRHFVIFVPDDFNGSPALKRTKLTRSLINKLAVWILPLSTDMSTNVETRWTRLLRVRRQPGCGIVVVFQIQRDAYQIIFLAVSTLPLTLGRMED